MDIKELKQQYLRENILEKNYDAEEFMDFCESHYGSVDIDSWSFDQLKKVKILPYQDCPPFHR